VPGLCGFSIDGRGLLTEVRGFARGVADGRVNRAALVAEPAPPVRWVVVAAEPITDVDTTAADTLGQLLQELRQQQVTLAFAELKDPVEDRLKRYGLFGAIGPDRFFPTIGTAVDGYVQATGTTWVDWEERPATAPDTPV
jgi:STAS domain